MDYAQRRSLGIDDNLPVKRFKLTGGPCFSKDARVPLVAVPHGTGSMDAELEIHCLATEAYSSVLRAFMAQSDFLSWDKEGLISKLRKELGISDVEHGEIFVKVGSDDFIKKMRDNEMVGNAALSYYNDDGRTDLKSVAHYVQEPVLDNGKLPRTVQSRVNIPNLGIGSSKRGSNIIHMRVTVTVIHEVETILGTNYPGHAQVEEAQLIFREHEKALVEALERIDDISESGEQVTLHLL